MVTLRAFLLSALLGLVFQAGAANAQETPQESVSQPQSHVVTSLQGCLDKLDDADAASVRTNYTQPWQECQKRLQQKAANEKAAEAKEIAEGREKEPETPRNYVRVQKVKEDPQAKKAEDTKKNETKNK